MDDAGVAAPRTNPGNALMWLTCSTISVTATILAARLAARSSGPTPPHAEDVAESDEKYKMAYDAALRRLTQQEGTLGNLRVRAAGLLTVAGAIATFTSTIGLIGTDNPISSWWALWLLLTLTVILYCALRSLLPVRRGWSYGAPAKDLLDHEGDDIQLRLDATMGMVQGVKDNEDILVGRSRYYEIGACLLVVEVALAVAASVASK
ncbi:hypothetical protein [Wenjunlia tyrosinilytica]|uniref:Uncharacterized protein n=1 Tax=Wenjunlia tyrosinilytica TaxID=1544741 RepID=A0A917ZU69_9ACTN|nr:hypothetical protein [Wenjunlia tyrosinilytica]GGO91877.1 hypothetical protein GCM10012280_40770 [Wenjunlia tyrosinilytica]